MPFGARVSKNGKLIPIKSEQKIISTMVSSRDEGKTYKAIADELNTKKIPSKTGRKWQINVVRRIILSQKNLPLAA